MNKKLEALEYLKERDYGDILEVQAQVETVEENEEITLKPFQIAGIEGVKRKIEEVFDSLTEMYNREINELI